MENNTALPGKRFLKALFLSHPLCVEFGIVGEINMGWPAGYQIYFGASDVNPDPDLHHCKYLSGQYDIHLKITSRI